MDHVLGDTLGLRLLAQMRQKGVKLPPTYMISGCDAEDLDLKAILTGADGFIAKGSRSFREELLAAVQGAAATD